MTQEKSLAVSERFSLVPKTFSEAKIFAEMLADSDFVPKQYYRKPGNILIAVQMGLELGLQPINALQNIAVINGKPSIYGDAMIAVVRASGLCEYIDETIDKSDPKNWIARCVTKRKGEPKEREEIFTTEMAIKGQLWGKAGPWTTYPDRMLKMRARGFLLRDVYGDVLCGLISSEEAADYEATEIKGENAHKPALSVLSQKAQAIQEQSTATAEFMVDDAEHKKAMDDEIEVCSDPSILNKIYYKYEKILGNEKMLSQEIVAKFAKRKSELSK